MNKKSIIEIVSFYALIIICLVTTITPFAWMVLTSFKKSDDVMKTLSVITPESTIANYTYIFEKANFFGSLFNSMVIAFSMVLLSLTINSLAAYAFAKMNFPGREKLFALLLLTMMVPAKVTMMPVFVILKSLGLLNSYSGIVISGSASVFAVFMLRQFMYEIPDEMLEAARIDGCSEFKLFYKIMLPLCKPVLATLSIICFINAWNELLWPLILMLDEKMFTLPVALSLLTGSGSGGGVGVLMAASVTVVVPIITLFMMVQKFYIRGITAGALKG